MSFFHVKRALCIRLNRYKYQGPCFVLLYLKILTLDAINPLQRLVYVPFVDSQHHALFLGIFHIRTGCDERSQTIDNWIHVCSDTAQHKAMKQPSNYSELFLTQCANQNRICAYLAAYLDSYIFFLLFTGNQN